jgi:hypothetical protein
VIRKKIFTPSIEKVKAKWKKFHDKELNNTVFFVGFPQSIQTNAEIVP